MLNKYVWNLYLESGGKDIVEMFRRNMEDKLTVEYADEIAKMHKVFCPMEEVSNAAHSFNYELPCRVNKRVPRVYFRDGKVFSDKT